MAIPKVEDFLYPFLLQIKDSDISNKEIKERLIGHFGLTEEDGRLKTKSGIEQIVLIDGIDLAHFIIEYNVGVSTRKADNEVKRLYTDFFEEYFYD